MRQQSYPIGKIALFRDREQAAQLLVRPLETYCSTNTVFFAVPRGGVPVGYHIAQQLHQPMEILPCRKITHPGDRTRSIGSVCLREVVIHDSERDIPQEYIQHAVNNLRASLRRREEMYHRPSGGTPDLKGKTVIIVDDWLRTGDTILACLRSIRKQEAKRIIVAAPIVTSEALKVVSREVDDVIFLILDDTARTPSHRYFPPVSDVEVMRLIRLNRRIQPNREPAAQDFIAETT